MNKSNMSNNKNNSKSGQASSLETTQLRTVEQVKPSDELISLDEVITRKQVEVDNPNFILGYN